MSYLFPLEKSLEITPETRPLTQTGSIQVYLQLAEKNLFVQGFDQNEYQDRPPTLLRGSLVLRILKPSKIKSITLNFKGVSKTEWPEGIPPKRQDYFEENDLVNHTWPFYSNDINGSINNPSGADIVRLGNHSDCNLSDELSTSSLNLDTQSLRSSSTNAFNIIKRATSPSPTGGRHRSNSLLASLKATATNSSASQDSTGSGADYSFQPGDYVYNFEHAIPASTPETIDATFGSVSYSLSVSIERSGAFKSNIATTCPIRIIRAQSEESVEDSEPIAISRDWEDQLHYDIVIATKAIILNAYLPVAFKLVPLDKIKLHRIRIYLTENLEYYCRNKKVHRMEPVKKYLLLEHKAPPPPDLPPDADAKAKKMGNLLTSDGYDVTAKEFEFQVYVPQKLNNRQNLHPNTSYTNIKAHHWIKICLRLSRVIDGKPKHYEISIDSPIHVLDPLCSHANTLLPAYGSSGDLNPENQIHDSNIYFPREILGSPPLSPEVTAVNNSSMTNINNMLSPGGNRSGRRARSRSTSTLGNRSLANFESTLSANVYKPDSLEMELTSPQAQPVSPSFSPVTRPIHLIRRPSFEPPPFDADISPPPMRDLLQDGIQGLDAAVLDRAPKDPPTYADYLEEEARSPNPISRIRATTTTTAATPKQQNSNQPPQLTFTNSTPSPPLQPKSMKNDDIPNGNDNDDDERVPRQLKKSDIKKDEDDGEAGNDIADNFRFRGTSPNMPASIGRSPSPEVLRIRTGARSSFSRSTSNAASPRASVELNRNSTLPQSHSDNSGIDSLISQVSPPPPPAPRGTSSASAATGATAEVASKDELVDPFADDTVQQFEPQLQQLQPSQTDQTTAPSTQSRNMSKASIASSMSPTSMRSLKIDTDNEVVDLQPLLQTTTTNTSITQPSISEPQNPHRPSMSARAPSIYDFYQSRESLDLLNESSSVDITALYSSNDNANNIFNPLNDDDDEEDITAPGIRSYTPNAVDTNKVINNFKDSFYNPPVFKRNMSFGVQSTNPILSALDIPDEGPASQVDSSGTNESEESSLKDSNSTSTLTSANFNEEVTNKPKFSGDEGHDPGHFLENSDGTIRSS